MRVYKVFPRESKHTVYCRYSCANCGQTSSYIPYTISKEFGLRTSPNQMMLSQQDRDYADNEARKLVMKKMHYIQKNTKRGYWFTSPFFFGKAENSYEFDRKCSHCGWKQKQPKSGMWAAFLVAVIAFYLCCSILSALRLDIADSILLVFSACVSVVAFYLMRKRWRKKFTGEQGPAKVEYVWENFSN